MKTTITKMANAISGRWAALALFAAVLPVSASPSAEELIRGKCLACHTESNGEFSRISKQRKTPEGWLMTVARMQVMHGLKVDDEERRTLVKHLADTQGLAPSETAGARYILERRLNTMESFPSEQFTQMCARCHSGARVMLQRRPVAEWEHLVHFHLGQFPTTEYQALGRDRDWFGIALKQVVPELAAMLPFDSDAWRQWQAKAPAPVAGDWTVSGHMPGRGGFVAVMQVKESEVKDRYALTLSGTWDDGKPMSGKGNAVIYTGFEWRGDLEVEGKPMQQVFALENDLLKGRMFLRDQEEVGADVLATRQQGKVSRILAVHPAYLKAGQEAELRIIGSGLSGKVQLPTGVKLVKVVEERPDSVTVQVRADKAARGVHELAVGNTRGGRLALYDRVAAVKVMPEFSVARTGGNGASVNKVEGRFDAEAWAAGPDGKLGTKDDYRIGVFPAKWSVAPFDEVAVRDQDVKFAGVMDEDTGVFTPGAAGPNPARRMTASNVGNLKVIAEVGEGKSRVKGEGQLIVAPQRWNNPPIR